MIFHLLSTNLLWAFCLLSLPVKWVCSPDCTKCVSAHNGFRRHSNSVAYSDITDLEHLIKNMQLPLTSRPASLKSCSSISSCTGLQSKKKGEKHCIHFCPERVFVLCIFLQILKFYFLLDSLNHSRHIQSMFHSATPPVAYWFFICPISGEWNESDTSSSSTCFPSILFVCSIIPNTVLWCW